MKKEIVKELLCELMNGESKECESDLPFEIGESYLIRTVTRSWSGS